MTTDQRPTPLGIICQELYDFGRLRIIDRQDCPECDRDAGLDCTHDCPLEVNRGALRQIEDVIDDYEHLKAVHESYVTLHNELIANHEAQQKELAAAREALDTMAGYTDAPTGSTGDYRAYNYTLHRVESRTDEPEPESFDVDAWDGYAQTALQELMRHSDYYSCAPDRMASYTFDYADAAMAERAKRLAARKAGGG